MGKSLALSLLRLVNLFLSYRVSRWIALSCRAFRVLPLFAVLVRFKFHTLHEWPLIPFTEPITHPSFQTRPPQYFPFLLSPSASIDNHAALYQAVHPPLAVPWFESLVDPVSSYC